MLGALITIAVGIGVMTDRDNKDNRASGGTIAYFAIFDIIYPVIVLATGALVFVGIFKTIAVLVLPFLFVEIIGTVISGIQEIMVILMFAHIVPYSVISAGEQQAKGSQLGLLIFAGIVFGAKMIWQGFVIYWFLRLYRYLQQKKTAQSGGYVRQFD